MRREVKRTERPSQEDCEGKQKGGCRGGGRERSSEECISAPSAETRDERRSALEDTDTFVRMLKNNEKKKSVDEVGSAERENGRGGRLEPIAGRCLRNFLAMDGKRKEEKAAHFPHAPTRKIAVNSITIGH